MQGQEQMALPDTETASTLIADARRIYYVNPLLIEGEQNARELFSHARSLGFSSVLLAPPFEKENDESVFAPRSLDRLHEGMGLGASADDGLRRLVEIAGSEGLRLLLDLVPPLSGGYRPAVADPRRSPLTGGMTVDDPDGEGFSAWVDRVFDLAALGLAGFRCLSLAELPVERWRTLIEVVRGKSSDVIFLAYTPGTDFALRSALADAGFDGCFSSFAWWNLRERWLLDEDAVQRDLGLQIAFPEAPFSRRIAHGTESAEVLERRARRALELACFVGDGLLLPMGFEFGASVPLDPLRGNGGGLRVLADSGLFDLTSAVRDANGRLARSGAEARPRSPLRMIPPAGSGAGALYRGDQPDLRTAKTIEVALYNPDLRLSAQPPLQALQVTASGFSPLTLRRTGEAAELGRLKPGAVLFLDGRATAPIKPRETGLDIEAAVRSPRLAIEAISPCVEGGRLPVKRVAGETVRVEADIFADGHDPLAASLLFRALDEDKWHEVPMRLVENDRWRAEFPLKRMGRHAFAVEAWRNPFAIFRYEFEKKNDARLDLALEIQEGIDLVTDTMENAAPPIKTEVRDFLETLTAADTDRRIELLLAPETFALMARADRRPFRVRSEQILVDAERQGAAFASWYELFPRSQSGDPERHGTFDDVIRRLPAVRDMGFDVVYFPPIHPIGKTNRKGRNNSLKAGPNDPGSPYAIGSEAGGHEAIHPELGTFEDFRRLVDAAREEGLEVALDLAIQASPDHPWLKQHPGWFAWRPDGTIRYAENPPKKYEDIVNVDFYAQDAVPSLWLTLRDIVQLWVDQGVKLFRVDNPHTKPFPFWEWLIGEIRANHPDVVFLSEAFTRPKVMYRLAKIGFSQSYTYFTWRNTKWELEEYMREITTEAPKDFFRPHFFVNTHDINPDFLQNAPRPAYLIRAALAATLSGLWGVYNGFELCEGRPDAKRKEYADSEKYEIRAWDWDRPGNIIPEITLLNRIRRENPAFHSHLGLTLLPAWNDQVMFFEKTSPGRENVVLVAISLDPHSAQEADVELPLYRFNLPDDGVLAAEDLIRGNRFSWTGKHQRLRLAPDMPFAIWRAI
jgi:starch synthase (maltosyl-transferring)